VTGNERTGWVGGLPRGGDPQQRGLLTLPRGLEELALGNLESNPIDMRGKSDFYELAGFDTHHYTRGELYVLADSIPDLPAGVGTIAAEVQVIAQTGGIPDLLAVATVNSGSGPLKVQWGASASYNIVSVWARQMINGVASGAFFDGTRLDMRAAGRLYR
jgi:hypothetical protein